MRLKPATVSLIAKCICGDPPLPFPYRTGRDLSEFFQGLGFDYRLEGSRNPSVQSMLTTINLASPVDGEMPSTELASVIEELMNRSYFEEDREGEVNYSEALNRVNNMLAAYGLEVESNPDGGMPKLLPINNSHVSSEMPAHGSVRKITFCPSVFKVPRGNVSNDLVAVMMPFSAQFNQVYDAIKESCRLARLRCQRVDDVWNESTIMQDIFNLIFMSKIVVVDFSGKNPNVMYETGIAHTLGKHVVPITQSIDDVPFDLKQHRVLKYLPNYEGLSSFQTSLSNRLITIVEQNNMLG